ncbi:MAG: hypothetical protein U9R38_04345 [Candidatus Margulisiibacteriota bacterium]|nr:hypothetical protein [Candidatus Margulisiibacteriota bacterium]
MKSLILLFVLGIVIVGCAPKPAREVVLLKDSIEVEFAKSPSFVGQVKNIGEKDVQLRSIAFTIWKSGKRDWIKDAGVAWFAKNLKPEEAAVFEVNFPELGTTEGLSVYSYELRWYDKAASRLFSKTENATL